VFNWAKIRAPGTFQTVWANQALIKHSTGYNVSWIEQSDSHCHIDLSELAESLFLFSSFKNSISQQFCFIGNYSES